MLNPDARSLYTAALAPPPGYLFDQALATTFSLDPTTLLTVPLHLALLGAGREETLLDNAIALLGALHRVTDRITVYAQRGRMQAPQTPHVLYGLLEQMVVDVRAPRGGEFHPKLWVLRFVKSDSDETPWLRLLVLSRNLTADRSWDLSLQLEGEVRRTGPYVAANRELGELLRDLPTMACSAVSPAHRDQAERLSDEVRRTRWTLPEGYDSIQFHVLGRVSRRWTPPYSSQMAVLSPFVTKEALNMLCDTTDSPVALISRPETLLELDAATRACFTRCLVLDEAAETEDGEDTESRDTLGLHAKALILRCGWDTHLFVGSANATSAALMGANIEVLAELVGKRSRVQGIDELLGPEGLQGVLTEFVPPDIPPVVDAAQCAAEQALEQARAALAKALLRVRCLCAAGDWRLILTSAAPIPLDGVASLHAWPLTVPGEKAVDASGLTTGTAVDLGCFATASVTGLIAFELIAQVKTVQIRFALNLPIDDLPAEREAAILRLVMRNRDGFLRYVLMLLGDLNGTELPWPSLGHRRGTLGAWGGAAGAGTPLLEELTRAFSRNPERLYEVGRVVKQIQSTADGGEVVPLEFLELWAVFTAALSRANT